MHMGRPKKLRSLRACHLGDSILSKGALLYCCNISSLLTIEVNVPKFKTCFVMCCSGSVGFKEFTYKLAWLELSWHSRNLTGSAHIRNSWHRGGGGGCNAWNKLYDIWISWQISANCQLLAKLSGQFGGKIRSLRKKNPALLIICNCLKATGLKKKNYMCLYTREKSTFFFDLPRVRRG